MRPRTCLISGVGALAFGFVWTADDGSLVFEGPVQEVVDAEQLPKWQFTWWTVRNMPSTSIPHFANVLSLFFDGTVLSARVRSLLPLPYPSFKEPTEDIHEDEGRQNKTWKDYNLEGFLFLWGLTAKIFPHLVANWDRAQLKTFQSQERVVLLLFVVVFFLPRTKN